MQAEPHSMILFLSVITSKAHPSYPKCQCYTFISTRQKNDWLINQKDVLEAAKEELIKIFCAK